MKKISSALFTTFYFGVFLLSTAWSAGAPLLENISFKIVSDTKEQIIFQINAGDVPSFFVIKGDNPRVVFDFPNTTIGKNIQNNIDTNGKYVKRIRVGLHKGPEEKVRVVFDLTPNEPIDIKKIFDKDQQSLTITIQPVSAADDLKEETPVAMSPQTDDTIKTPASVADESDATMTATGETPPVSSLAPLLSSIKFDKSSNRGEMLLFKLNDFYPPVVFGIEEELPRVVCDFMDTKMTADVPAVFECDGQYIKTVRTGAHQNPNKIRVVLDLAPHNNYDLQQVFFKEDNLFVLIINKIENVRNPEVKPEEKPMQ